MIPMGYEFESLIALVTGAALALVWLAVIVVLFIQWLCSAAKRMSLMTAWEWVELSGWLFVISTLAVFDSYLIFYR
jgi:hypothetical protein